MLGAPKTAFERQRDEQEATGLGYTHREALLGLDACAIALRRLNQLES
jgi:hypothetical protein